MLVSLADASLAFGELLPCNSEPALVFVDLALSAIRLDHSKLPFCMSVVMA